MIFRPCESIILSKVRQPIYLVALSRIYCADDFRRSSCMLNGSRSIFNGSQDVIIYKGGIK
jgi:hypothetical protein